MKRFTLGLTALFFLNGCGRALQPQAPIEQQALQKKLSPFTDSGDVTAINSLEIILNECRLEEMEAAGNFFLRIHTTQGDRLAERMDNLSEGVLQKNGELLGGEQATRIAELVTESFLAPKGEGFLDQGETEELVRLFLSNPEEAEVAFEEALDEEGYIRETQALAKIYFEKMKKDTSEVLHLAGAVDLRPMNALMDRARKALAKTPGHQPLATEYSHAVQTQARATGHSTDITFQHSRAKELKERVLAGYEERKVEPGSRTIRLNQARDLRKFMSGQLDHSNRIHQRTIDNWRGFQKTFDLAKGHVGKMETMSRKFQILSPIGSISPAIERRDK